MIIKILIWMLILAFFHARQEIEIEGKAGWAGHLPTFRINVFFRKLLGGKALTGYHLYMIILFITIFHGAFLFIKWSWEMECKLIALLCWYFVVEDFLWFLSNKNYRWRKFWQQKIEWHKRWFLHLPVSYWGAIILGIILFTIKTKGGK